MITQFSRSTQPLATQLITSQQPLIPTPQTHPSSLQLIGSQTIGPQYCNTNPNAFQYQKNPGFHINNQFQPLSPLEYRQDTLPFVQTPAQPINNQYEQQHQGGVQQQPLANMIVYVVREQFRIKPKDSGIMYRYPYPEYFDRVSLPNRYNIPNFSKYSGQDNVTTYEHISHFWHNVVKHRLLRL